MARRAGARRKGAPAAAGMNYWILCGAACLAALFLTALAATLLLRVATPAVLRCTEDWPSWRRARLLFALQMLPAATALAVAVGLVLPGFLRLEPVVSGEQLGLRLGLLARGGAVLCALASVRFLRTW